MVGRGFGYLGFNACLGFLPALGFHAGEVPAAAVWIILVTTSCTNACGALAEVKKASMYRLVPALRSPAWRWFQAAQALANGDLLAASTLSADEESWSLGRKLHSRVDSQERMHPSAAEERAMSPNMSNGRMAHSSAASSRLNVDTVNSKVRFCNLSPY